MMITKKRELDERSLENSIFSIFFCFFPTFTVTCKTKNRTKKKCNCLRNGNDADCQKAVYSLFREDNFSA